MDRPGQARPPDPDRRRPGLAKTGACRGRCRRLVGAARRRSLRRDYAAIAVSRPRVGAHRFFRTRRSRSAKSFPAHPRLAGRLPCRRRRARADREIPGAGESATATETSPPISRSGLVASAGSRMRRAIILRPDDANERAPLLQALQDASWTAEPLGDLAVLVSLPPETTDVDQGEEALIRTLGSRPHRGGRPCPKTSRRLRPLRLRQTAIELPGSPPRLYSAAGRWGRLFAPHPRRVLSRDGRRCESGRCRNARW